MAFVREDQRFFHEGAQVEADFPLSFEALAPYCCACIDAANEYLDHGVGFEAVVIRKGQVTIRREDG